MLESAAMVGWSLLQLTAMRVNVAAAPPGRHEHSWRTLGGAFC